MSPEEMSLVRPLVDVQPIYNLTVVLTSPGRVPPETQAFVRMKLREAARTMRETAQYIETKLRETVPAKEPDEP
jgi:hypothetical protein